ncbi:MAG: hypothetical protein IRY83_14925 [Chloroflexi bacterium]|nr:hypothetical protein [Chloroflexota bacterium]
MAKLTDFENPISGDKGNIFDLHQLWQYALGGVVVLASFGVASWLYNRVRAALGAAPVVGPVATQLLSPLPGTVVATNNGRKATPQKGAELPAIVVHQ